MEITKTKYAKNRKEWRKWLEKNYDKQKEIWLIFYKKHTGKPRVSYNDAVEEALCFGWIDSTLKRIDDEKYCQKFSPRNHRSGWSELNIMRVNKLIKEGKMTDAGMEKFKPDNKIIPSSSISVQEKDIPSYIIKFLKNNPPAYDNFKNLAVSHKRNFIRWITDAKREETRLKRLTKAIQLLKKGEKLGFI
ncbi:MAG: YdeI/OmpD-associated family protein [Ignavibacteriae bacterium]|nr:YdeI/OmpD-associated family protein [Ignavibacteriota bacterium]